MDGKIEVLAQGGLGGFKYSFNNLPQVSTNFFDNIGAGVYPVSVIDSFGCQSDTAVSVLSDNLELRISARINEGCIPGGDGLLGVYGFPTDSNYLYSIDSINWQRSGEFDSLVYGDYETFLLDPASGCTASRMDSIRFKNNLPLNDVEIFGERCFKTNTGRVMAPNPNYTYALIPKAGNANANGITNIPPGIYTLIAEQANGFMGSKVIDVGAADSMWIAKLVTTNTNVHCYAEASVEAEGGAGEFFYTLEPSIGIQNDFGSFEGLCWGDYIVSATDSLGCRLEESFTIGEDLNAPFNMFDFVTVYPNPANNIVYFKSDYLFDYEVSLINTIGQCLKTRDIYDKNGSLDISDVAPGIYVLRFKSQVDHADNKIIISR